MRVVFVSVPAAGHLDPMVPLARELDGAGHEVVVASGPGMVERAATFGLSTLTVGVSLQEAGTEMRRRFPGGLGRGPEQWKGVTPFWVEILAPPRVSALMAVLADERPDLIVHDPCAYAGPLVARLLGIPSVCHHYSAPRPRVFEYWGDAAAPLWDRWDCPPRPFGGANDYLVLGVCPPSLWNPDPVEFPTYRRIRPVWTDSGTGPEWLVQLPDSPTVYVSFGTAFGRAELFHAVLDGLSAEALNLVVTVGAGADLESLRARYPDVYIERYIPQSTLLPHSDLVVCHAGSGTMLGALAHGLPMLCVPLGADHFFNAELCASAGVARMLGAEGLDPRAVRSEVLALLDDQAYRARAASIREEIDLMPAPAEWVQPLKALAAGQWPG
jgi:UDP:flavonoid glycosyltransferase YjiC (YdhE family)